MPNFQLPTKIQSEIISGAGLKIDRTETYAMAAFPLTLEQVQFGLMAPETVAIMRALVMSNVKTISTYSKTNIILDRADLPGLTRSVALQLVLPDEIFLHEQVWCAFSNDLKKPKPDQVLTFDVALLSPEDIERLTNWANNAVRQHRLARVAVNTVVTLVNDHLPTTAHIRAVWPAMATLVVDKAWRQKCNVPTHGMKRYEPSNDFLAEWGKRMALAEMLIVQGDLMPPFQRPDTAILPSMLWWEPQAGDVRP